MPQHAEILNHNSYQIRVYWWIMWAQEGVEENIRGFCKNNRNWICLKFIAINAAIWYAHDVLLFLHLTKSMNLFTPREKAEIEDWKVKEARREQRLNGMVWLGFLPCPYRYLQDWIRQRHIGSVLAQLVSESQFILNVTVSKLNEYKKFGRDKQSQFQNMSFSLSNRFLP